MLTEAVDRVGETIMPVLRITRRDPTAPEIS